MAVATIASVASVALAWAAAAAADAPAVEPSAPPGLQPTTMTLAQIVAAAEKAFGRASQPVRTTSETWNVTWDGGSETDTMLAAGDDYEITTVSSGLTDRYGRYHDQLWDQNENGVVTLSKGIHGDSGANFGLIWRMARESSAQVLGEVASPGPAFVVEVAPAKGHRTWLFFNKSTGLLDRAVVFAGGQRSYDFTQYQTIDGMAVASRVREIEADKTSYDFTLVARRYNDPIPPEKVRIPDSRSLVEFPSGVHTVRLPARATGDENRFLIIRVTINGRGLDFLLDSGSAGIVLDSSVANELGLKPVGGTERGQGIVLKNAVVPEMDVGQLHMHDVVVATTEVEQYPDMGTKIVGLLGYDFIASAVLKIDYVHSTVDAFEAGSFVAPTDATPTDVALDDYVPMVSCEISGATAKNVVIDTGADRLMLVYSTFANAHFVGAPDPKKNVFNPLYFPFEGGWVPAAEYRAASLAFGGFAFGDVLIYVTYDAKTFETAQEDSDGLIGHGLLQYFDVYFDYPHSRLYTVPNTVLQSAQRAAAPRS